MDACDHHAEPLVHGGRLGDVAPNPAANAPVVAAEVGGYQCDRSSPHGAECCCPVANVHASEGERSTRSLGELDFDLAASAHAGVEGADGHPCAPASPLGSGRGSGHEATALASVEAAHDCQNVLDGLSGPSWAWKECWVTSALPGQLGCGPSSLHQTANCNCTHRLC